MNENDNPSEFQNLPTFTNKIIAVGGGKTRRKNKKQKNQNKTQKKRSYRFKTRKL
jgi:hypothetical protein